MDNEGIGTVVINEINGVRVAIITQEIMAYYVGLVLEGRLTTRTAVKEHIKKICTDEFGVENFVFEDFPLKDYKWDSDEPYPWWRVINEDGTLL